MLGLETYEEARMNLRGFAPKLNALPKYGMAYGTFGGMAEFGSSQSYVDHASHDTA